MREEKRSETDRERNERLEGRYRYDREGYESTLAYVSANQNELALEYLDRWRPRFAPALKIREAIEQFEESRFGATLEPAASGMLRFAICKTAFSFDSRYTRHDALHDDIAARRKEIVGEFDPEAVKEPGPLTEALRRLSEQKTMPKAGPSWETDPRYDPK